MAEQIPIKVLKTGGGDTCGLAQFSSTDSLAVSVGGTGLTTQGICAFAQPGINAVACKTTYIGICAGKSECAANENTYVGYGAGQNVTTGCYHTIIGSNAGDAITTCHSSVLIGYNAGTAITFGIHNTAIGFNAGSAITTSDKSTFVGYNSGCVSTGGDNTALGTCTLAVNTVGVNNVAIGSMAGKAQAASGCDNVYIGSRAGQAALCQDNTLVGSWAGVAQTTATGNVFLGVCVGYGTVGGAGNVYLGFKTGLVNTSGNNNVFIGNCAGVASTASCCLIIGNGTCDIITGDFATGNVAIAGTLSKGSGSFNINHPLESKKDTHNLVHSFIEGPRADLIYRGVIELIDGNAEINVDTVSGMTEGTFVAINRCVQAFTNNESNWDNVRGNITDNILTIESNDSTSTASISWMVIGERCDKHMMDTAWTDDDGKVIVEPEYVMK